MAVPERATLLWLFRTMATIRAFEERHMQEVNAGKTIGGGHSSIGEEAVLLTIEIFAFKGRRLNISPSAKGIPFTVITMSLY